jgi:hypothetical protein
VGIRKDNTNNSQLDDMLFLLVENALDKEGVERVEKWLSSGPEAKKYYLNFGSSGKWIGGCKKKT